MNLLFGQILLSGAGAFCARFWRKKEVRREAHSSSRTPPVTSTSWLKSPFRKRSTLLPAAPVFGSYAPKTTLRHGTGLQGDIDVAVFQPPVAEGFCRALQRHDLGMADGGIFPLLEVAPLGDDAAVLYDDGAHGHLVRLGALGGELQRPPHKLFIRCGVVHDRPPSAARSRPVDPRALPPASALSFVIRRAADDGECTV